MFLDTTSISDSTLSSSVPHQQPSAATISNETSSLVNEPLNCQKLTRGQAIGSLQSSSNNLHRIVRSGIAFVAPSSVEFIENILLKSLWRIRTWLSASVGAFWATLGFINHFIESKLICGPLFSLKPLATIQADDNRQLAWRETPMISFHDYYDQQQHHQQLTGTSSLDSGSAINPEYLAAVNRAQKWSEEAALVLGDLAGHEDEYHNNNNRWASCSHGSLYNNNSNRTDSQFHCTMDHRHRGRVVQRAGSENNHAPSSESLSTPLALPLHDIACPQASYPDALQIQRHAITFEGDAANIGTSAAAAAATNKEVRRGPSGGAQQQKTPTDFQGQQHHNTYCSGSSSSGLKASSQSAMVQEGDEFAQHKHHYKQQQQEQQRTDQTPLGRRLGLSRALFNGMQKSNRLSAECESCEASPVHRNDFVTSSGPFGSGRQSETECNQLQCEKHHHENVRRQHQFIATNNHVSESDRSASLVLVSKSTLNNLTEQIAFSMNKMRDLEEKVRVIPELERRLHNVISDTSSSLARPDSRSSSIGIRDSKYSVNQNNPDHYNVNYTATSSNTRSSNSNYFPRRSSLNDNHDVPYKTMFSSSLRQPYGGSMRYTPGFRASNHIALQQSGTDLARASSFSISSPHTSGKRYFDRPTRGSNNISNNNTSGNSGQSLDTSNAIRSTQGSSSFNSSSNLGPQSTKVEYEDLINDLISLSYSVNYLSSNSNSAHSQSSSSGGGGGGGRDSNHSQIKEAHGNKLELHDATRTSKAKHNINSKSSNNNNTKHVISPEPSNSSTYHLNNNNHHHFNQNSTFNSSMNHLYHHTPRDQNNSHHPTSYLARNNFNGSGSLSLQTTPVKTHLDCGCQSFKEHLKYNSISREQRLNGAKSQQVISSNNSSNNASPQPDPLSLATQKADASTNTDLSMLDVVSRSEISKLVEDFRKSTLHSDISASPMDLSQGGQSHKTNATRNISTSPISGSSSSSGSATGPNSSSQQESRSISSGDERFNCEEEDDDVSDDNVGLKTNSSASAKDISDDYNLKDVSGDLSQDDEQDDRKDDDADDDDGEEEEDEDEEEIEVNLNSIDGAEEAYSLGSSYQDPSDFEEYCAYGESLDRRTKDFLSQTTKIPNDLRFALIRLNDSIKKDQPCSQIESSSNCIDVIRKEWFEVAASKDAQVSKTKLYVDFFESFTKQLLNMVVNLSDTAGNTAMHYAASHFKLDIIEILLSTKVCDVNCRNKAGYTPIMLLALAELEDPYEQEVARHLFSMGDVNIKARSSGQTALMLAASHGRIATCKLLLECGADPSLQDYDGSTALMCGSELGNEDVVRCLLAHKLTDPNATDNDGLDALTIAMNNGHKSIGLILYAAKNVPRMTRSAMLQSSNPRLNSSAAPSYLGASLRRSRGKSISNHVRRADSLLGQRHTRSSKLLAVNDV